MLGILWFIVGILVVFWVLGLLLHIAAGFIHILLVIAVVIFLYNLFVGNRSIRG